MNKENIEKALEGWTKLLNPSLLKKNLMFVAVYLAAYEMLKNSSLVDRVRSFFTNGFDKNGPIISEDYQRRVVDRDKSPMKASALWFLELGALVPEDMDTLDKIREYRNEIAHKLPKIILSAEGAVREDLLAELLQLIKKLDIYWIRNVEMDGNPEFENKEIPDTEIASGNMIVLNLMIQNALGNQSEAEAFYARYKTEIEQKLSKKE